MAKLSMNIPKGTLKRAKQEAANGGDFQQAELDAGRRYNASITGGRTVKVGKEEKVVIDIDVPEANDGKGGKVGIFYSLEEDRLRWLLMDLAKLGYDIDAIESGDDIAEILTGLKKEKPGVRIKTVQSGEYVNIKIDRLLKDGEEVGESTAAESEDDEEEADEKPAKKSKKVVEEEDEEDEEAEEKPAKKAKKVVDEDEEDDEEEEKPKKKAKKEEAEEDDEEEEDEKPAKKKAAAKDEDEDEEAEEEKPKKKAKPEPEEKEVSIEPGLKCKATIQGKEQKVEILEVFEKEEKVRVKVLADNSVFKISVTKLSI